VIRTSDSDLSRYVMWYLQSPVFRDWIKLSAEGATGSHTRAKSGPILRQRIPLPPVNEQRRIVDALEEQFSRLDAADDSLRRAEHRLESFRTSVVAAATAGYPSVELGALVSELRYGTSIKCLYDGAGLPVIRIPNIVNCRVDMSDLKFATDSTADLSSAIVAEGDLLFVRTNGSRDLIGRVAVVHHVEATAFASYLIRARPDRTKLEPRYAAVALSTPVARALIEARAATTAGQYNLNQQALRSLPIPLPPLAEQQRIIALVEQQLSVIEAMRRSTETARDRSSALRRSILERAFRGELVPQDPCDEPASVLVARMAVEHATASPIRRRKVLR
jgi:type I restriction enzyme S subunit